MNIDKCTSILLGLIGILGLAQANGAVPEAKLRIERLTVPAAPNSAQASVIADRGGRLWLSWIEREGPQAILKFAQSRRDGRSFGQPREIARGNDWFVNWADFPALLPLGQDRLAAFWLQKSAASTYAYDVRISRSADAGLHWSPPFSPHQDGTQTEHGFVSLLPWTGSDFAAIWLDGRATAGGHGSGDMALRGAVIAADGKLVQEWPLDARTCDCCQTDAALTRKGAVVVYRDRSADEIRDIYALTWDGRRWSEPAPVHADGWKMPACPVNGPAVIAAGNQVWVAWYTGATTPAQVRLAHSTDGAVRFAAPQTVSADNVLGRVDLAYSNTLGLGLSWLSEDASGTRLWLATFDEQLRERQRIEVAFLPRGRGTGFPRLVATSKAYTLVWTESEKGQPMIAAARIVGAESAP